MMTWNAALVFTFGAPVPGREAVALQNFADAQSFFGKLAAEDKCEVEAFLWGYGGGMLIVKGESAAALQEILDMEESHRLLAATTYTSQDFRYQITQMGETLAERLTTYSSVGAELGYL